MQKFFFSIAFFSAFSMLQGCGSDADSTVYSCEYTDNQSNKKRCGQFEKKAFADSTCDQYQKGLVASEKSCTTEGMTGKCQTDTLGVGKASTFYYNLNETEKTFNKVFCESAKGTWVE